jgi:NAD(P)-dependent dehydrogenase (short-subunit alcohol dehydrogenase family)
MARLAGKVAFVSGAGGGIGRAICERFIAEGAAVVATDVKLNLAAEAVAGTPPERALSFACDVTSSDAVRAAISRSVSAFGKLDILCNVAGGSTPQDGMVTEAPEEEFWRAINLDLFGTFLCCKHGLPELISAGGGSVVNMASIVGIKALPGRDCYTAAKGGIMAMTRSMAVEYAPHKIRVNAIAPGATLTPRVKARLESNLRNENLAAMHLLGFVEPMDVAHMAVYLASDESCRVTGQILSVDSGASIV